MGLLFDNLFKSNTNIEYKREEDFYNQYSQSYQTTNTNTYLNQITNDLNYSPIININSPESNISPQTKKELKTNQDNPIKILPTQPTTQPLYKSEMEKEENKISGLLSSKNILIIGLLGLGLYYLSR